jgi:hypothetical protein
VDEASGHLSGVWGGEKEVDFLMGGSGAPAGRRRSWQGSLTRPAGTPPASPTAARPQASPDHPSAPPPPPLPKLHKNPSGDLARLTSLAPAPALAGRGSARIRVGRMHECARERSQGGVAHRPLTQPSTSSSGVPFA